MNIIKKYPSLCMGLTVTLVFLWLGYFRLDFLDGLELKLYDVRMRMLTEPQTPSDIVIVEIDNDSIDKLGRWPWPRSYLAVGLGKIAEGQPRAVGLDIVFSEPEENTGLKAVNYLEDLYAKLSLNATDNGILFQTRMAELKEELDSDKVLSGAVNASDNVVLPVIMIESGGLLNRKLPYEELLANSVINIKRGGDGLSPQASDMLPPIPEYFAAARGRIGHITLGLEKDGTVRRERLFYDWKGRGIPSYALRLAALDQGVQMSTIQAIPGQSLTFGKHVLPLTRESELLLVFKGPHGSFKKYSFFDVVNDKVPPSVFNGKLVILGVSAMGIINPFSTPIDPAMPQVELTANTVWAIQNARYVEHPAWDRWAELAAILIIGLIVTFVFPRMKAGVSGAAFVLLLGGLAGGATAAFAMKHLWISTTYPALALIIGYIGVISIKYLVTEARKDKVEGESAETNRMLGLSFQTQGMLDMAFDKFRRVPVDDGMKDILYNLALDFERKRQFNKAVAVYEYIEEHDAGFKDIAERKKKMIQVGETIVLGGGTSSAGTSILMGGDGTKPTLGRYEIIKQLGKGAMGIVYLGKDPRINRTTAIKTFQLGDDIEPDEAEKLKKKFFQEAESAGTLTHPNIVTIYDAGEEQDLAFIAMEFLEGEDLKKYARKENLLPLRQVVGYMADVAEALDYAHQKGIVHRDIKPANLMLLQTGVIKITDFGIARITASSQTQTGVVKGTPHYMSPEQISGQKVDGRSDIFSLGVVIYQMLTGELPFSGENIATLMHQIMNEPHPDPRTFNPALPKPLAQILDKALVKDRDQRYQRASQLAAHLRKVGEWLDSLAARPQG